MNFVPVKDEADKSISHHQNGDSNPKMGHAVHNHHATMIADLKKTVLCCVVSYYS
jgi:hypothetical protein